MLAQWWSRLSLPVNAPYFLDEPPDDADCTAYAYGNFHGKFMKNRVTLIGCLNGGGVTKADGDYQNNSIKALQS